MNLKGSFQNAHKILQLMGLPVPTSYLMPQASGSVRCISSSTMRTKFFDMFLSKSNVETKLVPSSIPRPPYIIRSKDVSPNFPEIKTKKQIEAMKPACRLAASILKYVEQKIEPGMTTEDIDVIVHSKSIEAGAYPSPLLYRGFPKSVCTSVNHVACHGIPSSLVLQDGDIINVDITVFFQGYHGDTSATFLVGNVDKRSQELVNTARDCRDFGIHMCKDGAPFSDIGEAIYTLATQSGFSVIPQFCGHGIGTYFHGPPNIVHIPSDSGPQGNMEAGMTFTVEPIICDGSPDIKILSDEWTAVTCDKGRSAQFEHTILVTKDGFEILTQLESDNR